MRQVSPRISAEKDPVDGYIHYYHTATEREVKSDDALSMIARDHHISKSQALEVVKRELNHPVRHRNARQEWSDTGRREDL